MLRLVTGPVLYTCTRPTRAVELLSMVTHMVRPPYQCSQRWPSRSLGHASSCNFTAPQQLKTQYARLTIVRQSGPPTGQQPLSPPSRADPRQSISRQRPLERRPPQPPSANEIYLPRRLLMNKQAIFLRMFDAATVFTELR